MLDSAHYQHAETFDGFRFVCAGEATTPAGRMGTETKNDTAGGSRKERGSKFTDVDWKFPFWGLGKRACPGRFYASALLKVTLARLLLQYDFRLPTAAGDGERPLSFTWRSAVVPRQGVRLMVRRRGSAPWRTKIAFPFLRAGMSRGCWWLELFYMTGPHLAVSFRSRAGPCLVVHFGSNSGVFPTPSGRGQWNGQATPGAASLLSRLDVSAEIFSSRTDDRRYCDCRISWLSLYQVTMFPASYGYIVSHLSISIPSIYYICFALPFHLEHDWWVS